MRFKNALKSPWVEYRHLGLNERVRWIWPILKLQSYRCCKLPVKRPLISLPWIPVLQFLRNYASLHLALAKVSIYFNKLTAQWFSETEPFMHLSNHVFRSHQFQKYLSYEVHFLKKCSKLHVDSKNAIKKQQNVFGFLDNCIWIGSGKLSLLWRKLVIHSQSTC